MFFKNPIPIFIRTLIILIFFTSTGCGIYKSGVDARKVSPNAMERAKRQRMGEEVMPPPPPPPRAQKPKPAAKPKFQTQADLSAMMQRAQVTSKTIVERPTAVKQRAAPPPSKPRQAPRPAESYDKFAELLKGSQSRGSARFVRCAAASSPDPARRPRAFAQRPRARRS